MVEFVSGDAFAFLTSGIGILLQVTLLTAAIIPGVKFLSKRAEDNLNIHIKQRLDPAIANLCKQVDTLENKIDVFVGKTDTAIKYLDRALMAMRTLEDDKEVRTYKYEDSGQGVTNNV